ncbi:hypothetical protein [Confluentibacter sediminis]|uniref:hypothetical protein n=1 Tax=Confluentibacter sediminis TaxID=2219045 RepID=UPI000DAD34D9|nr:hypothetical protein [Confluentibacter sediminis]
MRHNYLIIVYIFISFFSCNNDDDNYTGDIIILEVQDDSGQSTDSALANGETLIVLTAKISPNADNSIQNIEFNKSDGKFLGIAGATATRPINENGTASIIVKVPNKVERLFFNCKVSFNGKEYFSEAALETNRAYPDILIIEPSTINVSIPATIILNTFLSRSDGDVSEETAANFTAYQIINGVNVEVGRFTNLNNAYTNHEGLITVNFHTDTNDIDTSKPVVIKVTAFNDLQEIIEKQINLTIN